MRKAFKSMARKIEKDSEWYLISTSWINKWQKHAYFDLFDEQNVEEVDENGREHPGKVDCEDITLVHSFSVLQDPPQGPANRKWMDQQIKPRLKEGDDFMIVDAAIHKFWLQKYGKAQFGPIERRGILNGDEEWAEGLVETQLKKVRIMGL